MIRRHTKGIFGRRVLPVLALFCFTFDSTPALAGNGDGGTQSPFSALGAGSRALSLGQAFVSVADDASAIYWNPATLRDVKSKQLMGMYMPLYGDFTDATYTFLGATYPTLSAGALGVGFMRVGTSFEGFDDQSIPTGTQDYSETQILVGYAFERRYPFTMGTLAAGLNFKISNQKIMEFSSTSPGVDVGFRYVPDFAKSLAFGLNLQDVVGPSHKLVSEADQTDRTIRAGVGYTNVFAGGSAVRVMLQLDAPERAANKFHMGAEYAFSQLVSLRMGIDDGDLTFGVGFAVKGLGLDYAFVNREAAGASHPVTFTVNYGKTLLEQRELLNQEREAAEQRMIKDAFAKRVQEHRERALKSETLSDLPTALDEWKIVLGYMPGDEEATDQIKRIKQTLVEEQERTTRDLEKQAKISAHFARGLGFYQENDYSRAREEWMSILEIDPNHGEARVYMQRTQEKIAERVEAHRRKAGTLEKQGKLTQALSEWTNVQALAPENEGARNAIARIQTKIQAQSRDLHQAEKQLKVVRLYEAALDDYTNGRYQLSIDKLGKLLRLAPRHEEAKKLHAMAQRKLTPLTKEEEETIRRLYLTGMQLFSNDEYAEAIVEWQKILEIDPTNESVQKNIDEARQRLKQLGRR